MSSLVVFASTNALYLTESETVKLVPAKEEKTDTLQIKFKQFARDHWTDQERENVAIVIDFVQHLMNNHDFEYVKEKFGDHPYTQHNRAMNDGMSGVIEFVSDFAERFPEYTYDVKHIYVDGDFVIFHSHSTIKQKHRANPNKGLNIIDTWRVKDGQIVEHWDSIQAVDGSMRLFGLMSGGKIKNANTLY
ncbi:MAG: nuclear transport factor 2 family protein [Bacteroidota bacterium]